MSKKNGSDKGSPTLPEDVQHLITRKLRHRQREQQKRVVTANQTAYAKLRDEVLANIRIGNNRKTVTSVPLAIYKEIVANATTMTEEWPGTVWEIIASILSKAQFVPHDGLALNKIVDEFAWAIDQRPFTLDYIDPERFIGIVRREASRFGANHQDDLTLFKSRMELVAAAAQSGIANTARQAREGVGIAVDEYLLKQRNTALLATSNSNASSGDIRKLATQKYYETWRKEYRSLKRKFLNKSDRWYAQRIAKMDMAKGRDAETIRKHLKK